jgi:hypothetical protein
MPHQANLVDDSFPGIFRLVAGLGRIDRQMDEESGAPGVAVVASRAH